MTSLQSSFLLLITVVNPPLFIPKKCASYFHLSTYDILKIILKKAHNHDMISIRMLKICDEPIGKPLGVIFPSWLENGKFSSERKKNNVFPVLKKTIIKI